MPTISSAQDVAAAARLAPDSGDGDLGRLWWGGVGGPDTVSSSPRAASGFFTLIFFCFVELLFRFLAASCFFGRCVTNESADGRALHKTRTYTSARTHRHTDTHAKHSRSPCRLPGLLIKQIHLAGAIAEEPERPIQPARFAAFQNMEETHTHTHTLVGAHMATKALGCRNLPPCASSIIHRSLFLPSPPFFLMPR